MPPKITAPYHQKLRTVWETMNARCHNERHISFRDYGAKGVAVCRAWRDDFSGFYAWAIKNGYAPGLQIDRVDNLANYSPRNCRWVTRQQNQNNRSDNRRVVVRGKTYTATEAARHFGVVNFRTILYRLYRGWSDEAAVLLPIMPNVGGTKRDWRAAWAALAAVER